MIRFKFFSIILVIFAIILFILLIFSQFRDVGASRQYGPNFDTERKKRKLPILGKDAYTSDDWTGWRYPRDIGHCSKSIDKNEAGGIIFERDNYYSGKRFKTKDNRHAQEYIITTYSFKIKPNGSAWSVVYFSPKGKCNISIQEAEKILKEWGIDRLNY